jgi:hypothetical protein
LRDIFEQIINRKYVIKILLVNIKSVLIRTKFKTAVGIIATQQNINIVSYYNVEIFNIALMSKTGRTKKVKEISIVILLLHHKMLGGEGSIFMNTSKYENSISIFKYVREYLEFRILYIRI